MLLFERGTNVNFCAERSLYQQTEKYTFLGGKRFLVLYVHKMKYHKSFCITYDLQQCITVRFFCFVFRLQKTKLAETQITFDIKSLKCLIKSLRL